jgi:hypothetical protein
LIKTSIAAAMVARKLVVIANAVEAVQDGRIFIELVNAPFLFEHKGTPAEYKAGLEAAIGRGWLVLHEAGTYVRLGLSIKRKAKAKTD